jgi:UDP-glucose 6-dehydrogenase
MRVAIIGGKGVVGRAYSLVFPDAYIYDVGVGDKAEVNECDLALVCVPTNPTQEGELDMSIVEEVIGWLDTPLILIKSALMPGTVDKLVEKTGKKIAVSVEFIGEGNYPVHFWKYPDQADPRRHAMLIVGGEEKTATACAEILWRYMSPDIKIHITTAKEAEITKLVENSWGAVKVTFANALYSLAEKSDSNPIRIHQAFTADGRVSPMHMRAVGFERGWASKCWDKDVQALASYAESVEAGDMAFLINAILDLNEFHKQSNEPA